MKSNSFKQKMTTVVLSTMLIAPSVLGVMTIPNTPLEAPVASAEEVTKEETVKTGRLVEYFLDKETNKSLTKDGEPKLTSGKEGEVYKSEPVVIEGYNYDSTTGEKAGTLIAGDIIVTHYYKAKETAAPVLVKYYDVDDKTKKDIAPSGRLDGLVGDAYKVEQKDIVGYTFEKAEGNLTGAFTDKEQVVELLYKKRETAQPVTFRYVDEKGAEIQERKVLEGFIGDKYKETAPEIKGYNYVKTQGLLEGSFGHNAQVVTLEYKEKDQAQSVTFDYVTKDGKKVAESKVITGHIGDEYDEKVPEFDGYKHLETEGLMKGKLTANAQKITIYYEELLSQSMLKEKTTIDSVEYGDKKVSGTTLPNTDVKVTDKTGEKELAKGTSDKDGKFELAVKEEIKEDVIVTVTKEDVTYKETITVTKPKDPSKPQGDYIPDGRYVTIVKDNYSIWSNFNWKFKQSSSNLYQQTLLAKGRYEHENGATYYSLYDNNGVWQGYINANGTKEAAGKQGAYIADGRYVTITSGSYNTWSNFNWKHREDASAIKGKTYQAKGRYNHANGSTYYSLYDFEGNWQGYINAKAAKVADGPQGVYIADGRLVRVTQKGYNTWSNFNWKKRQSNDAIFGRVYQAKGRYNHMNGSTYYSLYDNKGNWQGYINANATK